MFSVIYQGYIKAGKEEEYKKAWHEVANYFIERRGSLGSRLHQTPEGLWVAYSCWPDKATRDNSWPGDNASSSELPDSILKAIVTIKKCIDQERNEKNQIRFETCMDVVDDLLNGHKAKFDEESVELVPDTTYKLYNNVKHAYNIIDEKVVEHDKKCVPAIQAPDIIDLNYVIKDYDEVVAGICADVYIWKILFISLIFVHEDYRHKKLGSLLIRKVEEKARSLGAKLAHLDTFSFQAKDFYIKHGYEIFGVLDDCPPGHKRYYLKKNL